MAETCFGNDQKRAAVRTWKRNVIQQIAKNSVGRSNRIARFGLNLGIFRRIIDIFNAREPATSASGGNGLSRG